GLRQRPRNWIRFAHQKGTHLRVTRIALGLTLTTLLATTAMAQKISTESAPGTNFGGYKTFMWVKQPTSRPAAPAAHRRRHQRAAPGEGIPGSSPRERISALRRTWPPGRRRA